MQATALRTAALVNALADDEAGPDAIADLLRAHGETGVIALSADDVEQMRAGALMLREVFEAGEVDLAAAALNRLLGHSPGALRLTSHEGRTPWHPHLDSADDAPWGEWFLASSCLALTVLVWDRQRPPGGVCASASCRHVFLTQGSGPPRRYCSRRCATRERVAAHRRSRA
ncbi:CGNR zinc finger domain-containing protein [Streptomyces liangshanensis]|uniref:CGNR zinc finger domain-containing protein n=1 Tax=Streptomyces liangshanensis TaxID=2717324 RepID=A0A6G9GVP1_9ACTN|nr:CGNR zinc finger domain-containing protein [Streptomyces liangshanensis]QIQ02328.1 CGNR zinc finger domain-containing protein [Streptomyces liangshanensis]